MSASSMSVWLYGLSTNPASTNIAVMLKASRTGGISRIRASSTRCQAPEPATSQVIFGQKGSGFTS